MSDIRQQRRLDILANPTETLKIECKSWLDLNDNRHKAVVAKAAIALANSDGGTIVFGISEDNSAGEKLTCEPMPPGLSRYTSDALGSAINKYADPDIDFNLEFENHPDTGEEYAFAEIAGGTQQPIFAKKGYDGVIKKRACYIRKPGPKSEEPNNLEWRDLLNRCVRANSDRLLDSIRTIIDGRPMDTTPTKSEEDKLREFMAASKVRWQERLRGLEDDDVAHLHLGYWAAGFSILNGNPCSTLNELKSKIDVARQGSLGGYDPFGYGSRPGRIPTAAADAIEVWLGNPEGNSFRTTYDCSFWRATLAGNFYYLEGHDEDNGAPNITPGRYFDISTSIKRYGEMLSFAARMGKLLGEDAEILICSEVTGAEGRLLWSRRIWWLKRDGFVSNESSIPLKPKRVQPQQIEDNLVEILHEFLHPLYEQFKFYDLERQLVAVEIDRLKKGLW